MSSRTEPDAADGGGQVDVLNPWGEGSEILESIAAGYRDRFPGASVESITSANVSLEAKRLILTEEPPDAWASWVGPNLQPYHDTGVLGDVTDVWTSSDMERAFVDVAREAVAFDGAYRGLPLNVQRTNNLVYNVEYVERAGVDPTRVADPREFLEVLAQVDDAIDAPPLVVGFVQPFASQGLYMWEGIYLGQHGIEAYRDLLEGRATRRRSEVEEALDLLVRVLEYANDDALQLTEQAEDERFADGRGAFRMQGMWVGLSMAGSEMDYGTDWEMVAQPGTEGRYVINMDGLAVPSDPPHSDALDQFLGYAGSADGIDSFNTVKKSIPPRTDVSLDGYPPFVREQAEGFRRADGHVPSMAHGFAVPPDALVDLEIAFAEFIDHRDAGTTASDLLAVFDDVA